MYLEFLYVLHKDRIWMNIKYISRGWKQFINDHLLLSYAVYISPKTNVLAKVDHLSLLFMLYVNCGTQHTTMGWFFFQKNSYPVFHFFMCWKNIFSVIISKSKVTKEKVSSNPSNARYLRSVEGTEFFVNTAHQHFSFGEVVSSLNSHPIDWGSFLLKFKILSPPNAFLSQWISNE